MPKTRLLLPERFTFTVGIPVRITDLNYAGHVGNDFILSLIHEIRVQFVPKSLERFDVDLYRVVVRICVFVWVATERST